MTPASLPAGEWTPEQTTAIMIDAAIEAARPWADAAFLVIDDGLAIAGPGDEGELKTWAASVAGSVALNLVAEAERMAAELRATPVQRSHLIAGSVAVYNARLDTLIALSGSRGRA